MAIASRLKFLNTIIATALAGCAVSDDSAGRFLVAPDRHVLYNCTQLAKAAQATRSRQRKLEMLMAKRKQIRSECWSAAEPTGRNMRNCAA